jgi:hypothetical protein
VTHVDVDTSLYVVTGIFVVVVIVIVTQNLAVDIIIADTTEESAISTGVCMLLSLCLSVCSCILPGVLRSTGPGLFVPISTLLDWYFFYIIVSYMTLHGVIWVCMVLWTKISQLYTFSKKQPRHKMFSYNSFDDTVSDHKTALVSPEPRVAHLHSVNFMVCALLLSVFSTHGTMETVLTSPLLFVFMFRTIFKSYAIENSFKVIGMSETYTQVVFEPLLIALDIVVIGSIHVVGTQALAETAMHANTGFAIMLFIAHTLAYEGNRARRFTPAIPPFP